MTTLAFDIDGTIFDCSDIVAQAFAEGARKISQKYSLVLPHYSNDEIMQVVGHPTDVLFRILYPHLRDDQRKDLIKESQAALAEMVRCGKGRLIEGVKETIEFLFNEGYRICAASNGTKEYIEAIFEAHSLGHFFLPIVVINETLKNKSDIVKYYIASSPNSDLFIMIGDRKSDIDAARCNGIPFIGCAFGHMGVSEIGGEKWIAHNFVEIPNLVKKIEQTYYQRGNME